MLSIRVSFLEEQWTLNQAVSFLKWTEFLVLVQRFLFGQLNPNPVVPSTDMIEDVYPVIEGKIHIFNSAITTFYAPSDISGIASIHHEYIQATSSWRNGPTHYDCVLVNTKPNVDGGCRFKVA